jgi:hypothetical protein
MQQRLAEAFDIPLTELQEVEHGGPAANVSDPQVFEDVQLLQELDPADRATVRSVMRAFATKSRMAQLVINA